jgi:hypothetical protein
MTLRAIFDRLRNRRRAAAEPQAALRALRNQQAEATRARQGRQHDVWPQQHWGAPGDGF